MTVTVVSETEVRGKTGVKPRLYDHMLVLYDRLPGGQAAGCAQHHRRTGVATLF